MNTTIQMIVEICIIPILGILTKFIVGYLSVKKQEIITKTDNQLTLKYMSMIEDTISKCVIATNQTYVSSLKASGSFDVEAQKEAFNKTMSAVTALLSEDVKKYITETIGDLDIYLTQLIEAEVNKQK